MALLRDQDLAEYRTAQLAESPVATAGDRWLVLLDGDRPVCAIAPGTTLDSRGTLPPIIVAPDDMDVDAALASDALTEATDVTAVVLVGRQGVTGVWGGPSLDMALLLGPSRGFFGSSVLPGPPQIPLIVRSCAFRDRGTLCGTVSSFASKPFPMLPCPNRSQLAAHDFGW